MTQRIWALLGIGVVLLGVVLWQRSITQPVVTVPRTMEAVEAPRPGRQPIAPASIHHRLAMAALGQVGVTVAYDPAYVALAYPNGDVPLDRGVCSDVIVRAFRQVGWDLQRCLHEDMTATFSAYPTRWGLKRPDANIDHRRVLNLMTWFARQGWSVPISARGEDYQAGDVVAWDLGGGLTHVGVVVPDEQGRPRIVHNIGQGARLEDVLFAWTQIGHYRIR